MRLDDLDSVGTFVRRNTPLAADRVEALGAGTDSVAYRVDGEWVARFPVTAGARASLESELSLSPLLAAALPVPVPRFEHVARADDGAALTATYRLLDGSPLSTEALAALPDGARARALDELSAVLDALKAVPAEVARAAGARLRRHQGFGHPSQRELHLRHRDRLGAASVAHVEALWQTFEAERASTPPCALVHADLKPAHVLHAPSSGRLTGVLDWGDACISHADFDLVIARLFLGSVVGDALLSRLPAADAHRVASHVGLFVAVRRLCDLDLGAGRGDEPFAVMCVRGLRRHLDGLKPEN